MSKRLHVMIPMIVLVLVFSLLQPSPAMAAAYLRVTTLNDEDEIANGQCSLREAIMAANEDRPVGGCPAGSPGMDTIFVPNGIYYLEIRNTGPDDGAQEGDLDISDSLTIIGESKTNTIIRGTSLYDRIFHVKTTGVVTLRSLTVHDGTANATEDNGVDGYGGGILNEQGSLTISNCLINDNFVANAGGGVSNSVGAVLVINESEIIGNIAKSGGGVFNNGTITIKNSLIQGNSVVQYGGGFNNNVITSKGTLVNVTLTLNQAKWGSGIFTRSYIEIINSTISRNFEGPGFDFGGNGFIVNSIVARHAVNCTVNTSGVFTFASKGHNLEDRDDCRFNIGLGDKINTDPMMAADLANNGGSSETYALIDGSPAINAASNAYCPTNDQRGLFWSRSDGACDIGAYEFGAVETINRNFLPAVVR